MTEVSLKSSFINNLPIPRFGLIGHRGAAAHAPENTVIGFQKAAALGLNWVEFDIQKCGSGEWVLMHDETLERTTNGKGYVVETPYQVLKNLDAGAWFDAKFEKEPIPLLSHTLYLLAQLNIHPNIEIKVFEQAKSAHMEDFIKVLKAHWPKFKPLPLISSFDLELLVILRSLDPQLPLGYLVDQISVHHIEQVIYYQLNSIHGYDRGQALHEIHLPTDQLPIFIYTVNQAARIQQFLNADVQGVFSDLTHFTL